MPGTSSATGPGENTAVYGFCRPQIRSVMIPAATMEEVIPHFWKPVATYQSGREEAYRPI